MVLFGYEGFCEGFVDVGLDVVAEFTAPLTELKNDPVMEGFDVG